MPVFCPKCNCEKGHPKKIQVPVKGARKVGVLNGDVKLGVYVDIHGRFISPDGFAIDENGMIMLDDHHRPIIGDKPSHIPIGDYRPDTDPWIAEVDIKRCEQIRKFFNKDCEYNSLLPIDYLRIFNLRLNATDQELMTTNVLFRTDFNLGVWAAKTVNTYTTEVFLQ